jgi:hypothetical protein
VEYTYVCLAKGNQVNIPEQVAGWAVTRENLETSAEAPERDFFSS